MKYVDYQSGVVEAVDWLRRNGASGTIGRLACYSVADLVREFLREYVDRTMSPHWGYPDYMSGVLEVVERFFERRDAIAGDSTVVTWDNPRWIFELDL